MTISTQSPPELASQRGYDVLATNLEETVKSNATLRYNAETVKLWVYEFETSFSLAGSTAQSARTRSYFAHNLNQPSIIVRCQFPNQELMSTMVEFVRKTQLGMESTTVLEVLAKQSANVVVERNNKYGYNKTAHQSISAKGYIKSVRRVHEKFVNAPELEFSFIVENMINPTLWADTNTVIRRLKSWHTIIEEARKKEGFIADTAPDSSIVEPPTPASPANGFPAPTGHQSP
jgi:hypothetical protein